MGTAEQITARLRDAFAPRLLDVADESEQHRGHSGWRDGGETHFRVTMRADSLAPMTRVARHRAIHAALGPDLIGRIHALSLDVEG